MALAVPGIPAEFSCALAGNNDRLRPPPPADEKPSPAISDLDHLHYSATTAAQRIAAIQISTRNIGSRPFLLNFTPEKMPREPGFEPDFSWRNPPRKWDDPRRQDQRACRRSKKRHQAPEHLPTGWKASTAGRLPPSVKGLGGADRTRTGGLLNPNQARCHLRYCSIFGERNATPRGFCRGRPVCRPKAPLPRQGWGSCQLRRLRGVSPLGCR